jgi:hypothetical protein
MHRHNSRANIGRVAKQTAALMVASWVASTACSSHSTNAGGDTASPSSAQSSAAPTSSPAAAGREPLLQEACNDSDNICHFAAGSYQLGRRRTDHTGGVIPGLRLSLPKGWVGTENDPGELSLHPPGHPNAHLFIWMELRMVKSSGDGVEKKILTTVGESAEAITSYLVRNPDFDVVSKPAPVTIGEGIKTTSLVVRASDTVNFGLPSCPYRGKCVGLFTYPQYWDGAYSIGGPEQIRLYLMTFHAHIPTYYGTGNNTHTLIIGLATENATALHRLTNQAQPILNSLHLPPQT